MKFKKMVKCIRCQWVGDAYYFQYGDEVINIYYNGRCPNCGKRPSPFELNFYIFVIKGKTKPVWYNPFTWFRVI